MGCDACNLNRSQGQTFSKMAALFNPICRNEFSKGLLLRSEFHILSRILPDAGGNIRPKGRSFGPFHGISRPNIGGPPRLRFYQKAQHSGLFTPGCMTVTPDYHVEVSRRIHDDFDNGKEYYRLHGKRLEAFPHRQFEQPGPKLLSFFYPYIPLTVIKD